jgi:hypothetical protein
MHLGAVVLVIYLFVFLLNRGLGSGSGGRRGWQQPVTQANVVSALWLRLLAFFLFFILTLLMLGWFEGTLSPSLFLPLFLLGFSPGLILAFAPAWLLWDASVRFRRRWISRGLLYLAHNEKERKSAQHFVDAYCGRALSNSPGNPVAVNPWTLAAAALIAEREQDLPRAEQLFKGLAALPASAPLSPTFLSVGIELLCWPAVERGDWKAVTSRTSKGQGRGVRLLRALARAHLEPSRDRWRLILSWALAPQRTRTHCYLKEALAPRAATASERPLPKGRSLGEPPFVLHTRLLADAAAGREVRMSTVGRLARSWQSEFSRVNEARFRARGLEVGARNTLHVFERLRSTVLQELEAIASTSEGPISRLAGGGLAEELARRLLNRHYQAIGRYTAAFPNTGGVTREFRSPLEEWEDWLRFRQLVERLEALAGAEALQTAWHDGVQFAAWNWPFELEKAHGSRATWMCHVMYVWVADMAEKVGDEEAARVNRNNAKITQDR